MARPTAILLLALLALLAIGLGGCVTLRPSEIPEAGPMVAVKDWQFRPEAAFPQVTAHHSFIDFRDAEGKCFRLEIISNETLETLEEIGADDIFIDERRERPINLRTLVTGPKALRIQAKLLENAARYENEMHYVVIPGPNSNTFTETLLRQTPELSALLPHACVGKDFYATLLVGIPGSKDGIEVETGLFGAEIGLSKGVEAHLFGLTLGIALFPPALKIPGLRPIGWEAGTRVDHSEEYEDYPPTPKAPARKRPEMTKAKAE